MTFRRLNVNALGFNLFTPTAPQLDGSSNSGSTGDTITNDNTPTITGTVPANSLVRLYIDGVENGTPHQLSGGLTQFSITPTTALTNGSHSVTIRVAESSTVPLANMSNVSGALSITIDTGLPTTPGLLNLITSSDSGGNTTDNITNDTTPTFDWSASTDTLSGIAGYWWAVDDSTPQTGGTFTTSLSATPTVTVNSGHTMYVVAVDVAGNFSGTIANLPFTIDTIGPRVSNVLVKGSSWTRAPYSYASIVPTGKQLAPIYTDGVNSIQLAFNEAVTLTDAALVLVGRGERHLYTTATVSHTGFDPVTLTWTYSPLAADKYRIDVAATGVTDTAGNLLDGEWANLMNGTIDDYLDDPTGRTFSSGDGVAGGAFQFLFSYLPGDYNQDGVVDTADEVTLAETSTTHDGTGDGVETQADHDLWEAHLYDSLQMRRNRGDYQNDEYVNLADYALWRATYGSTVNLAADGNGNGTVDAADYSVFRYWENTQGAWYQGLSGFGAMIPIVDFGNAPKVANVTISGSNSTHDPYAFDGHDGSGEQLRTVPVGGADTISITFSEDVNVVAENLRVVGLRTFNLPTAVEFVYNMATMTATWRFENLVPNDHYLISLSDAVTDIEGNRLDGEWVNPVSVTTINSAVSEFPSGNGAERGNFNFVATILAADANRDNIIDDEDLDIWDANWAADGTYTEGDFAGDGIVAGEDYLLWDYYWGVDRRTVAVWGDLNGDYAVDDADLDILSTNLGMSNPIHNNGDLNGDGQINTADLDLMFAQYGVQLSLAS